MPGQPPKGTSKFLGSLRDALAAASRDDTATSGPAGSSGDLAPPALPAASTAGSHVAISGDVTNLARKDGKGPSAAEAAREARGGTPNIPPVDRHVEMDAPPTTRVVRQSAPRPAEGNNEARTQLVRGRQKVKRGEFHQDPVVGWLVIVGGLGLGSFRPIYEGNNTVGRSSAQRIAIDFGDDAISGEEQAFIRYDSADRTFLFVPNLAKTNVVQVNDKRPTAAVKLEAMDVITMGRTQLVFVPFCGADFDWSEIADAKA